MRAKLAESGGQTVTVGKAKFSMGCVVVVVDTGEAFQSKKDLVIKVPAKEKPPTTIRNHNSLTNLL